MTLFSSMPTSQAEQEKLARAAVGVQMLAMVWALASALTSNSLTLAADALGGSLEVASCILAYISLRLQRGSYRFLLDYGIGKLETLASLFIGFFTGLGALFVLYEAIRSTLAPSPVTGRGIWIGLIGCLVIASLCARLWWQLKEHAKRHPSPITTTQMRIQAIGFWSAVGVSLPLACSLIAHGSWVRYLDIAVSIAIGTFTARMGWQMIRHALPDVLDQSLSEPLQTVINQHLVAHFDHYEMFEKVRSRTSGSDIFIEIFLSFDPSTSIGTIQSVTDSIKNSIGQQISGAHVLVIASAIPEPTPKTALADHSS